MSSSAAATLGNACEEDAGKSTAAASQADSQSFSSTVDIDLAPTKGEPDGGIQNRKKTLRRRPKIAVLPRAVVDQIAAGEVVQRPVSVVKELLENSLDAGATQIVVQYDGLSKLSIVDNGRGIPKADMELLCTRHATSKLASVDDFSDLSTFGFRGEALASTSMVSRLLTVASRVKLGDFDDDQDDGKNSATVAYSQSYRNGKPLQKNPKPCARKVGTTITVEDLFYNVPHRQRAYSKRDSEEYGKIHKIIQDYAVHYPTVGFVCQRRTATSNRTKQLVVDCNTGQIPAVKALLQSRETAKKAMKSSPNDQKEKVMEATKQILSHVLESNLASHLLYMECSKNSTGCTQDASAESDSTDAKAVDASDANGRNNDEMSTQYKFRYAAEIYFTSPTYNTGTKGKSKQTQGKFILFLNHRLVDLPPLKRALEEIYADLGNPNRNKNANNATNLGKPVLVVSLEVPGCQVDVNVHPSKRQVALMYQEDLIRELSRKLKGRLEEDGQAFVAQSVTTSVRNPYAKTNNKRKRSSDQNCGGGCGEDCIDGGGDRCGDENGSETGPTKKLSQRSSQRQSLIIDDKTSILKANTQSNSDTKKVAPSRLIRTNSAARAGAIEPFLVSTQQQSQQSQSTPLSSSQDDDTNNRISSISQSLISDLQQSFVVHVSSCPLSNPSTIPTVDFSQPGAFSKQLQLQRCTCPVEPARRTVLVPKTIVRPKRVIPTPSKYTSIASLRKRVGKQQCSHTTQLIRKAFFMGVMSHQRSLIQCEEELVMINHFELAKELFYQLALARFGGGARLAQLGGSKIGGGNGGIHIQTVIAQALQCEDDLALESEMNRDGNKTSNKKNSEMSLTEMLKVNDSNFNLAQHVTARLVESAAMLDEYFSIRIETQQSTSDKEIQNGKRASAVKDFDNIQELSSDAILTGLPVLLDGHCPQPHALPIFLLRLATQVDWTREKHCFHGVCKELGNFYAMLPNQSDDLNSYVQHQLFPALSYLMLPSKNLSKNGHFTGLTKLSTLYKVFERC